MLDCWEQFSKIFPDNFCTRWRLEVLYSKGFVNFWEALWCVYYLYTLLYIYIYLDYLMALNQNVFPELWPISNGCVYIIL